MHLYLLIDFGTSSTKSALVDLDSGTFAAIRRHDAIPPEPAPTGRYEVSLERIAERFDSICASYRNSAPDAFHGIIICSEQLGFAVVDHETGHGLT